MYLRVGSSSRVVGTQHFCMYVYYWKCILLWYRKKVLFSFCVRVNPTSDCQTQHVSLFTSPDLS